ALQLWAGDEAAAHDEIARMIEGSPALGALDLLGRRKVEQTTRRLIARFLSPKWLQTELLLAHARLFFEDFLPSEGAGTDHVIEAWLAAELENADDALRDYYCYVLLDFSVADRTLDDVPLSAAIVVARQLGVGPRFGEIAAKELGLGKKRLAKIEANAERRIKDAVDSGEQAGL